MSPLVDVAAAIGATIERPISLASLPFAVAFLNGCA
jgi:hypothetical protein